MSGVFFYLKCSYFQLDKYCQGAALQTVGEFVHYAPLSSENHFFSAYIRIYSLGLPRKLRDDKIRQLLASQDAFPIETHELTEFDQTLDELQIHMTVPFFEKVLLPRLEEGYRANEFTSIKLLLKYLAIVDRIERKRNTRLYSEATLIDQGLAVCPMDDELLRTKERRLSNDLRFSIHEVSSGVILLYYRNENSPEEFLKMFEMLEDYKQVCAKLQLDRTGLIEECLFHYQHYYAYLQHRQTYLSYKDYLDQHRL